MEGTFAILVERSNHSIPESHSLPRPRIFSSLRNDHSLGPSGTYRPLYIFRQSCFISFSFFFPSFSFLSFISFSFFIPSLSSLSFFLHFPIFHLSFIVFSFFTPSFFSLFSFLHFSLFLLSFTLFSFYSISSCSSSFLHFPFLLSFIFLLFFCKFFGKE